MEVSCNNCKHIALSKETGRCYACEGDEFEPMEIKEVCENCDNYRECHHGEDYSTDCDGGFVPRKDLVELHRKLRKAVTIIEKYKESVEIEAVYNDSFDYYGKDRTLSQLIADDDMPEEYNEILKALEELR